MGVAAVWAGLGYIYLTQFDETQWWINHRWWAQVSAVVIVFLAAAIPWRRRRAVPAAPAEPARAAGELVVSGEPVPTGHSLGQ